MGTEAAVKNDCTNKIIEAHFWSIVGNDLHDQNGRHHFTRDDLRKYLKAKPSDYYTDRLFDLMNPQEGEDAVYLSQFKDFVKGFKDKDPETKQELLFRLYNNNTELLTYDQIVQMLKASMEENGMKFEEDVIAEMALQFMEKGHKNKGEPTDPLTLLEFKRLFNDYGQLLSTLSTIIDIWSLPLAKDKSFSSRIRRFFGKIRRPHFLSCGYIINNYLFNIWVVIFFGMNVGLFVYRFITFDQPSIYLRLARSAGICLNFDCCAVLVTMLRYTITFLRAFSLGKVFPVNDSRWFHELAGKTIFVMALIHTVAHILNIYNVVLYLEPYANWTCLEFMWIPSATDGEIDIKLGLIPGIAYSTGIFIALILLAMFTTAMPFLRNKGFFKVFYWTHQLLYPFYFLLLIHCVNFWKWGVVPAIIFCVEVVFRIYYTIYGRKTVILLPNSEILPSKVVKLVITKPAEFQFAAGDFIFVKIPLISVTEWHPFTISSAPEESILTLHIQAIGPWTTKLHNKLQDYKETNDFQIFLSDVHFSYYLWNLITRLLCCFAKRRIYGSVRGNDNNVTSSENSAHAERQPLRITDGSVESGISALNSHDGLLGSSSTGYGSTGTRSHSTLTIASTSSQNIPKKLKKKAKHSSYWNMENSSENSTEMDKREEMPGPSRLFNSSGSNIPSASQEITFRVSGNANSSSQNANESLTVDFLLREDFIQCWVNFAPKSSFYTKIEIDGPFGAPTSHNFWTSTHAVLIGAGIGVTPCTSVLRSIIERHKSAKVTCPQPECEYEFTHRPTLQRNLNKLKKVDFYWINREQNSFTWFVDLLSELELEQRKLIKDQGERFLTIHMYMTKALKRNHMKAIGLQLALDLRYANEEKHVIDGLKTRVNAGRPDWEKIFKELNEGAGGNNKDISIFYCGPPKLRNDLRFLCDKYGFGCYTEVF